MNQLRKQTAPSIDDSVGWNIALQVALCVVFVWIATRQPRASLYVWSDVAATYLLSTLFVGDWLAMFIERRTHFTMQRRNLFAALVFLAMLLAASQGGQRLQDTPISASFLGLETLRILLALVATSSAAMLVRGLRTRGAERFTNVARNKQVNSAWIVLVTLLGAIIVPHVYTSAKLSRLEKQLAEWQAQHQLGRSAPLAEHLSSFAPHRELNGRPVAERAAKLRAQVAELESQVSTPLPEDASVAQRLERAQQYAILNDLESTANTLTPLLLQKNPPAEACILLATAYEMHAHWDASLVWYQLAQVDLQHRQGEKAPTKLMLRSLQGIGYTQRKRGNYREAEAAYQRLLAIFPTADTHFLLAQFYEEAQHSEKAREHARAAMRLAPAVYGTSARELLDQIATGHVGCMSGLKGDR